MKIVDITKRPPPAALLSDARIALKKNNILPTIQANLIIFDDNDLSFCEGLPNGLRYLRWGGDGEAVQPEKG